MKWYAESKVASVLAAAIVILGAAGAILLLANTSPRSVADITGVATETTRDINSTRVTPVRYAVNGSERTALVPYATAMAGEAVTFPVDADGNPDWGSWPGAVTGAVLVFLLSTALAGVTWIFVDTQAMGRLPRARSRRIGNAVGISAVRL